MTTLALPARFGRYRMLTELGGGGSGRTVLAAGPDGRLVAVKHPWPEAYDGFRRAIQAAQRLPAAHTAAVVDADPGADPPWLATEFVPGPSLDRAVRELGPMPEELVRRLAAGLATAVAALHRAGVVHGDLRPSNVILAVDGVRLLDAGIARAADVPGGTELSRTEWIQDAAAFMPPEQAAGQPVTPASDLFQLGALLAFACSGTGPFPAPTAVQTLHRLLHGAPELGAVPAGLRPIVLGCLAAQPIARPTPEQILQAVGPVPAATRPWPDAVHAMADRQLAEIGALTGSAATGPPGVTSVTGTRTIPLGGGAPTPPRAGRRVLFGAAAGVCALVVGLALWEPWQGAPTRHEPAATPKPQGWLMTGDIGALNSVAFSPDGQTIVSASADRSIRLWNVATHKQIGGQLAAPDKVLGAAFTPDGKTVVDVADDGTIQSWDATSRRQTGRLQLDLDALGMMSHTMSSGSHMALSPDGHTLAVSAESMVAIVDLAAHKLSGVFDTTTGGVEALTFSPDGRTLATGTIGSEENLQTDNTEGVAQLWDVPTRKQIGTTLTGYTSWVEAVAFSPDGRTLAVSTDRELRLWNVATHQQSQAPLGGDTGAFALAFTPDGRTLASAGNDGQVTRWNIATARRTGAPLPVPNDVIHTIAISPNGHYLAAGASIATGEAGIPAVGLWPLPS